MKKLFKVKTSIYNMSHDGINKIHHKSQNTCMSTSLPVPSLKGNGNSGVVLSGSRWPCLMVTALCDEWQVTKNSPTVTEGLDFIRFRCKVWTRLMALASYLIGCVLLYSTAIFLLISRTKVDSNFGYTPISTEQEL